MLIYELETLFENKIKIIETEVKVTHTFIMKT